MWRPLKERVLLCNPTWIFTAAALCVSSPAWALTQPDGTTIPVLNPNVTMCTEGGHVGRCLDAEEGGMTIDPVSDAAVQPEVYNPSCNLTFKVLARGAGFRNTFGWYNATDKKPEDSDLHAFLLCSDDVGTQKALEIKNSPFYKGGKIGFFMATPEGASGNCPTFNQSGGPVAGSVGHIYYSEAKYNPDNNGPNSYIHLITYNSVSHPKTFYFGWEDLLSGGDNDFEDLLTRVDGITCSGGGGKCDTGKQGICATGTMQCQSGMLTCVQQNEPRMEECNAIDDDCDGQIDQGDNLCEAGKVCDRGSCVPKCNSGEFKCAAGEECSPEGLCVEAACKDKQCPAGQVCRGGMCLAPCDGVVCPLGQECRFGVCADPCTGVMCDGGSVCDKGVCVERCDCGGCSDSTKTCAMSGLCVENACANVQCKSNELCANGVCVDRCNGAVCPKGQVCTDGNCIPDTSGGAGSAGASGSSGNGGSAGTIGGTGGTIGITGGSSGSSGSAGSAGSAGSGASAGATNAAPNRTVEGGESGCGCSVPQGNSSLAGLGLGLGGLLWALTRRRRGARALSCTGSRALFNYLGGSSPQHCPLFGAEGAWAALNGAQARLNLALR